MSEFFGSNVSHNNELVIEIPSDKSLTILQSCIVIGEGYQDFNCIVSVKTSRCDSYFNICVLCERNPHCSFQCNFSSDDSPVTFKVDPRQCAFDATVSLTGNWIRHKLDFVVKPELNPHNLDLLPPDCCTVTPIPLQVIDKKNSEITTSSFSNKKKKRKDPYSNTETDDNTLSKIWNVQNVLNEGILIPVPKKIPINYLTGLYITDYVIGKGKIPKLGSNISILYESYFENGKLFESRMVHSNPLTFRKGTQQVIKGLDAGISDLREGGSREISIPPSLGYGDGGLPPFIPPNATLIFRVTLLASA